MKLDPVTRDGNVYSLDGVDVFLFPGRSSRRFMQLSAAPVEGALFDARKGYIEDTADPRYDQKDVEWNAGWTTTFAPRSGKQRWTLVMTVPFASLGVKPPTVGDTWTGNFTRVRRAKAARNSSVGYLTHSATRSSSRMALHERERPRTRQVTPRTITTETAHAPPLSPHPPHRLPFRAARGHGPNGRIRHRP